MMQRLPVMFEGLKAVPYVAIKPLQVSGVRLNRGDYLPQDSPIRKDPRRLESLCRLRYLRPIEPSIAEAEESSPEVAERPSASADLETCTLIELRDLCAERGLPTHGNRYVLRKRLQNALG